MHSSGNNLALYPHSSYNQTLSNRFTVCVCLLCWELGVGMVILCFVLFVVFLFLSKKE